MIIDNRYKLLLNKLIGKGGFGKVYKGIDLKNNKKVAIKIDKSNKYNNIEFQVYNKISNYKYLPKLIDFIKKKDKSFLIMKLYNKNCSKILKLNENYFNIKDICMLAIQIIQQLKILHSNNIIHRDIKPDNFVWDIKSNKFKLIDFGLCCNYIIDNNHINFERSNRCGTLRYMSINAHNKYNLSRKDDIISLAYSLILLYQSKLPWKGLKEKNKKKLYNLVKKIKKQYNENIHDQDLPKPLIFILSYANNLKFKDKPNYKFILTVFYDFIKQDDKYDGKWSWIDDNII